MLKKKKAVKRLYLHFHDARSGTLVRNHMNTPLCAIIDNKSNSFRTLVVYKICIFISEQTLILETPWTFKNIFMLS